MAGLVRSAFAVYRPVFGEDLFMTIRKLPHVVVALATLVAPLAALAQGTDGSVTTAPLATAPAMGMSLLALLAVVLTGVAAYCLRHAAGRVIAAVGFVAALTALAGLGYATLPLSMMIMVQGGQCAMQTTQMFNPMNLNTLVSHCPNSIQITSIQQGMACTAPCVGPSPCKVGQVLANNDACDLPACVND
jgi:hypothetical protein